MVVLANELGSKEDMDARAAEEKRKEAERTKEALRAPRPQPLVLSSGPQ